MSDEHDDDHRDRDDHPPQAHELSEVRALASIRANYDEVADTRMTFDDLIRLNAGRLR
jgi:hypothetical protein